MLLSLGKARSLKFRSAVGCDELIKNKSNEKEISKIQKPITQQFPKQLTWRYLNPALPFLGGYLSQKKN